MKWFDYQLITEQDCVLECIRDYILSYRRYCYELDREERSEMFDKFDVERPHDFRHAPIFLAIMKFCDKNCLRYEEFWDEAFRVAMKYDVDVYSPAFFTSDKVLDMIVSGLKDNKMLKMSKNPYFKPENYRGKELQDQYYKYVYDWVKDKSGVWERMVAAGDVPNGVVYE